MGVLRALGQKRESTDNTDDKSLNTQESTFSDSQSQHIHETFYILLELSSMYSDWYHNLQLLQYTALW